MFCHVSISIIASLHYCSVITLNNDSMHRCICLSCQLILRVILASMYLSALSTHFRVCRCKYVVLSISLSRVYILKQFIICIICMYKLCSGVFLVRSKNGTMMCLLNGVPNGIPITESQTRSPRHKVPGTESQARNPRHGIPGTESQARDPRHGIPGTES